jgi:segregation and condensation protein A
MSGDAECRVDPPEPTEASDHQEMTGPAGQTPHLELAGFAGPLEQMLVLARAQKCDLAKLSLHDFIEQLTGALRQEVPIHQKAEWVGMASWVVLLRSRLLLPISPTAQTNAEAQAQTLRTKIDSLVALQQMQALATWLNTRPQLGQDVFAHANPELCAAEPPSALTKTHHQPDIIEFLWATIALLDDAPPVERRPVYRPLPLDLHKVSEARERIFRLVVEAMQTKRLQDLVPPPTGLDPSDAKSVRRHKSGWTCTFVATLEMAKQGEITLAQKNLFDTIAVSKAGLALSPQEGDAVVNRTLATALLL